MGKEQKMNRDKVSKAVLCLLNKFAATVPQGSNSTELRQMTPSYHILSKPTHSEYSF